MYMYIQDTRVRVRGGRGDVGGGTWGREREVPASKYVQDTGVPRLYFCASIDVLLCQRFGRKVQTHTHT